jgi:CheY-like chemotaxis protein
MPPTSKGPRKRAGKDQRRSPRGPVSATVVLLARGKPLGSYRVLNLSKGGALLVGRAPEGSSPELEALVRLSTGRTVRARARVARQEGIEEATVFALAFSRMAPADQKVIGRVVLTALADARDATALIVAAVPEDWQVLRRELGSLDHPSFVVSTRQDALRFLEAPNVLALALVDLGLPAGDVQQVLSELAKRHPHVRRVALAPPGPARSKARTRVPPLAQATLPSPWSHESLVAALRD